jgi:hypothetical protein
VVGRILPFVVGHPVLLPHDLPPAG